MTETEAAETITKTDTKTDTRTGPAAEAPWRARLAGLTLGVPRRHGGLCVWPLLGDDQGGLAYDLLDVALAVGTVAIEEVSAGGSVPTLRVSNVGAGRVLLLDGEELVGPSRTASSIRASWWTPTRRWTCR